jgi:hypothetical protein
MCVLKCIKFDIYWLNLLVELLTYFYRIYQCENPCVAEVSEHDLHDASHVVREYQGRELGLVYEKRCMAERAADEAGHYATISIFYYSF